MEENEKLEKSRKITFSAEQILNHILGLSDYLYELRNPEIDNTDTQPKIKRKVNDKTPYTMYDTAKYYQENYPETCNRKEMALVFHKVNTGEQIDRIL